MRKKVVMFKRSLQCDFGWNQVENARITVTHVFSLHKHSGDV